MKNAHLGTLEVSRIGLGAMTMAGTYTTEGALDDAESIRTIHRALDLGVTHIDTAEIYGPFHSEEVVGEAIKGRRDQVVIATKFGIVSHAGGGPGVIDSSRRERPGRRRGVAAAPRHRPHRPVLPAPRRPEHPDRGDRRRGRRTDRRGQGPPLRPLRGLRRHDPPRPRRAAGLRAADRVLAVDPRRRGRDPAAAARARHRLRPLLAARPRPAHRADPLRRRLRRRRLAQDQPALHRRELRTATSRSSTRSAPSAPRSARHPAQTALAWILTRGDDIAPIPGTRRVARVEENTAADAVELTAEPARPARTTSRPQPAHATTRPTWPPSTS